MIIDITLIENFILATFVVAFFGTLGLVAKKALYKDRQRKSYLNNDSHINQPHSGLSDAQQHVSGHEINQTRSSYRKIIKEVNKHAKNLLHETTISAGEMLAQSKKTNEHLEEQLDKVLQSIAANDIHSLKAATENFDKEYQQKLQNIQDQVNIATEEMIQNTKNKYNEKLDEFTKELLKKGMSTQELIDKRVSELLTLAETEIAEYKKTKLATVDDQIGTLIQKVYRDVLRVSLPENIHKDLIIKSLEEAKKEGLFKF